MSQKVATHSYIKDLIDACEYIHIKREESTHQEDLFVLCESESMGNIVNNMFLSSISTRVMGCPVDFL